MKQYRYYIILLLTGLVWSTQTIEAQSAAELEKAYKEAYDKTYALAMTNKAKEFEASTKRLMDLCLKTGNEQMYYKAWSNLATYTARSNTYKGLEIADELRKYATEHDSKYGLFISTYTNSYIALRMNKIDLSEQLSEEAIQYKNRYLKDVNGAFIYWQLARIYIKKKQREKAIKLLDKIDDEPDLQPSHHTFKWVYKCDACYSIKPVDTVRFMAYYAELQKAIKKYKHYADPERMADFKYADLTGNYQKMLEMARQKTSSADRLYYIALAYEKMGQTTKALDTLKAYIVKHDSLINVEALNRAETNSLELKAARADNEAQTLRYEKHRLTFIWVTIAIIALFAFFAILTWFRHRQTQRMAKVQAAQEQIQKELLIARNIQMTMVPSEFPQREGLDMYASMTPAKEVGGDLYGYLLEGDKLYFAVGDVSGKGIPASLFMAQATRLFLTLAKQGMMPDEICTRMNDALSGSDNKNSMFVTFWLGLVTLSTGHLVFCNAGHNPPVIGGGDKHGDFLDMKPNVPIGLWPGIEYEGDEIDTIKGRPLFIYTDGLNEAENPALEQFGDDKLLDILRQKDSSAAQEVVETLKAEVEKHRNGAEPNDDLTMMRIKVE